MPKRKREAAEEPDEAGGPGGESLPGLQYARIERLIEIGQKALHEALKLARGFERQKLGRRQKTADAKDDKASSTRVKAEVQALKNLDLEATSKSQLQRQLTKVKRIQESPVFQRYASRHQIPVSERRDDGTITVISRLIGSNPVKEVLPGIVDNVREALGLEKPENTSTKLAPKRKHGEKNHNTPLARNAAVSNGSHSREVSDDSVWEGFSDDDHASLGSSETGSEGVFEEYDNLVASSGSDTDPDLHEQVRISGTGPTHEKLVYSKDVDMSLSPSDPDDSSSSSMPDTNLKGKGHKRPSNTTFLPSLMGGYWSGSDEGGVEATESVKPKKNRMGQQARRIKWERKFGDNANHVKKQARDNGWDPRRGATDRSEKKSRGRGRNDRPHRRGILEKDPNRRERREQNAKATDANSDPVKLRKSKSKEISGSLHPSWEAAKKAKEQKTTAPFQGKKVVFE